MRQVGSGSQSRTTRGYDVLKQLQHGLPSARIIRRLDTQQHLLVQRQPIRRTDVQLGVQ